MIKKLSQFIKSNSKKFHVIAGASILIILIVYYLTGDSIGTLIWILFFPIKLIYIIFLQLLHLPFDQSILASLFIGTPVTVGLWVFAFGAYKIER